LIKPIRQKLWLSHSYVLAETIFCFYCKKVFFLKNIQKRKAVIFEKPAVN